MKTADITDDMVVDAYLEAKRLGAWPQDVLMEKTGAPFKVCWRAMERACSHDRINYGVSLQSGWVVRS